MLKYVDTKVVFQEIPNEITLAINISGCPIKCPDCHSKYLWDNIGSSLNKDSLYTLIEQNKGVTCISFMGGDADPCYLQKVFEWVKEKYPTLKVAWYSGENRISKKVNLNYLDYIKIGQYIKDRGPLNKKGTNQRLIKIEKRGESKILLDITNKMQ